MQKGTQHSVCKIPALIRLAFEDAIFHMNDAESANDNTSTGSTGTDEENDVLCPECNDIMIETEAVDVCNYGDGECIMCNICQVDVDENDFIFQCKQCDEYEICCQCANELESKCDDSGYSDRKRVRFEKRRQLQNIRHFVVDDEEYSHQILQKPGCRCITIYKMTKEQLLQRIVFHCPQSDDKNLRKMLKSDLLQKVKEIEMNAYGRYDVSCVDPFGCSCVAKSIPCDLECDCQQREKNTIYTNYYSEQSDLKEAIDMKQKIKQKKQDSYTCGNCLNMQTYNVQYYVLQSKEVENVDHEFGKICLINNLSADNFKQ